MKTETALYHKVAIGALPIVANPDIETKLLIIKLQDKPDKLQMRQHRHGGNRRTPHGRHKGF